MGRNLDDAVAVARGLLEALRDVVAGYDWRARLARGDARAHIAAVMGTVEYLRRPDGEGPRKAGGVAVGAGDDDGETRAARFRRLAGALARAWAICGRADALADVRREAQFYEEVRVWMGKFDAEDRQARGEPIPEEVQRLLNELVAGAVVSGEVLDIYGAAGIPRPALSDLDTEFAAKAQEAEHPHLAIEALRALVLAETRSVTRHNIVRQRAFSERLLELMTRYTNAQLTSAEVIAALIEVAHEVAAEGNRGARFAPPLSEDELAFYDAVASNAAAVEIQGEGVLADIARALVGIMRRDVRTDWTVREDVKAKLRASVKRLLVAYDYPPDQQPEAIRLVMEQMESMALRLVA